MDEESANMFLAALKEANSLLANRAARADPLLVDILGMQGNAYVCRATTVYSTWFQGRAAYGSPNLIIRRASGAWGNVLPKVGEQVLIFVNNPNADGSYAMLQWRGHFNIEAIKERLHAIANWHLLNTEETGLWGPPELRAAAFMPDPAKPWRIAIPFDVLERHLEEVLSHHL
ncbi:hypothetical protein LP420_31825 [Massilia sp. B-10]|nr:hypothetical protein LP420_31825 [Massilia sp. B-10]